MTMTSLKEQYGKIPGAVKTFLFRALLLFIGWQLLYHLVLQPKRVPDDFLTHATAVATVKTLSLFYRNIELVDLGYQNVIVMSGKKVLGISAPCNALEIYVLYISFLLCYPGRVKRKLLFLLAGIPVIFIINVIRESALFWLALSHKEWVDISHHYIFQAIVYLAVFYIWVLYSKGGRKYAA